MARLNRLTKGSSLFAIWQGAETNIKDQLFVEGKQTVIVNNGSRGDNAYTRNILFLLVLHKTVLRIDYKENQVVNKPRQLRRIQDTLFNT